MTPTGPTPASSPASWPALAGLCTSRPTSSSSGCSMIPRRASRPTLPVAHWMTLYGTLLSLRVEAADGDAVVAGVGTGLQPAILVDLDDLSHTEPVRSDGIGDDVEAGVAEGVVDVVFEAGLPGEHVAAQPEGARLVE